MNENLPQTIRNNLTFIMRNHALAKFGDALINFIYSLAKTKTFERPFGERVYDKSLAKALHSANLRNIMPSNSSSGDLGDGAEALIGYAYLNSFVTLEQITEILITYLKGVDEAFLSSHSNEKDLLAKAFEAILNDIMKEIMTNNRLNSSKISSKNK